MRLTRGTRQALFWLLLGAVLGLYLVMVLWSLPRIAAEAGGLLPFDMRPLGYSVAEARAFLDALSPEGRSWYLGVQHKLDTIYPGLLALTLIAGMSLCFRGLLRSGFIALALFMAAADYLENAAVAKLLVQGGEDAAMIAEAAFWTQSKAASSTVLFSVLILCGIRSVFRRRRRSG